MSSHFLARFGRLLADALLPRLESWGAPGLAEEAALERPASREHGDLATNVAMIAARHARKAPREAAAELVGDLQADARIMEIVKSIEIAGPGFINLFLRDDALSGALGEALADPERFGAGSETDAERILLEFVSANPTGQLHVGHGRYAAYGDSLARILSFCGNNVTTEFYINDYGSQMDLFGRTLAARYAQLLGRDVDIPEEGYQGDYPRHIAQMILDEAGDQWLDHIDGEPDTEAVEFFKRRGAELVLGEMDSLLERIGVHFDKWFSESWLYDTGATVAALAELQEGGDIQEREGALWMLSTRYGDDKDRVLVRSSGEPTYFASDIAYHRDKLARQYDRLINIWGADHHGYVDRMKAAFAALSHDPERLEIIIGQLVNIMEMGERRQMSKRAGTMVTLEELVDAIGVDATRFFLVDRSHDTTLDLDLEKAKLKSEENPVYYVQYAHARISSILRKAQAEGIGLPSVEASDKQAAATWAAGYTDLEPQERDLVMKILEFPQLVLLAGRAREPHRLTGYGRELAATFHVFYHNCRVIGAPRAASHFRMGLCLATANTIRQTLQLIGVSAPERM